MARILLLLLFTWAICPICGGSNGEHQPGCAYGRYFSRDHSRGETFMGGGGRERYSHSTNK